MNPVLIDAENNIIAGHGRVLAARKLGLEEVPCVLHDHLTETQRKAYILADNKMALNAGWDEDMLRLELRELGDMGFDLELTRTIVEAVGVPVIASGGVGALEHLAEGVLAGGADAVLAASIFHFGEYTIRQAMEYMAARGVPVRL